MHSAETDHHTRLWTPLLLFWPEAPARRMASVVPPWLSDAVPPHELTTTLATSAEHYPCQNSQSSFCTDSFLHTKIPPKYLHFLILIRQIFHALLNMSFLSHIPALAPPPGETSNFVNPECQRVPLVVLNSVFVGLMIIFVSVRLYTKGFVTRSLGWEDCGFSSRLTNFG